MNDNTIYNLASTLFANRSLQAELKNTIEQERAKLEATPEYTDLQNSLALLKQFKDEEAQIKAQLEEPSLQAFVKTGKKDVGPTRIKEFHTFTYEETTALEWAREHMPDMVMTETYLAPAFEKILKQFERAGKLPDFVRVEKVRKVQVKGIKKLNEWLTSQLPQATEEEDIPF